MIKDLLIQIIGGIIMLVWGIFLLKQNWKHDPDKSYGPLAPRRWGILVGIQVIATAIYLFILAVINLIDN